mgnify:CR=1 FL=1
MLAIMFSLQINHLYVKECKKNIRYNSSNLALSHENKVHGREFHSIYIPSSFFPPLFFHSLPTDIFSMPRLVHRHLLRCVLLVFEVSVVCWRLSCIVVSHSRFLFNLLRMSSCCLSFLFVFILLCGT